jgi:hypothetical protein
VDLIGKQYGAPKARHLGPKGRQLIATAVRPWI